ncbi:MAG: ATP-dependent Clp protease adaptor ClpS [Saprospiraceae bacterium]|nr:ATP-dependent Clp protease adaptor ClpS [Saprospiraceae bacterium]HMW37984.1 ATP-dependent Clp protease adaptor ClpS [Saprospiraceae bacterium]HMX87658.1 ATP-dependent Clp protease adaptor ClpS [Saprospiraceae bacterium]HMZ39473.1 ATP-dependent Clp protease adaptor ClpS [Saprospiraceae bacterium]HNA63259.1 ATP-dependent Clp protease adaptor ClpS [Saprospiraceae bacterium]
MPFQSSINWESLESEVLLEEHHGEISEIVVFNDDVNTFDWVIECLIEICKHSQEQAEQLSYIVHFKGRASVKVGAMTVLRPMKDALCERGLSAVIESIKV